MKLSKKTNQHSLPEENNAGFLKRFFIYQKERFPLLGHGLLIMAFTFSAVSYSRISRGEEGFIDWHIYFAGVFVTFTLFLLVRIFDEFKDAADDDKFKPQLPVPRGVMSLKELLVIGIILVLAQIVVNLIFFPKLLIIYLIVFGYLSLMGKEFFVGEWLKRNQFWYVTSHMFIIPLIDVYATGLDWLLEGKPAPFGLIFFFAVSYMNGIVLEVGRKIRTPENETEGVLTYSSMLGANRATYLWLAVLFATFCLAIAASFYAGYGLFAFLVLGFIFTLCTLPAWLYLRGKTPKSAKAIEIVSGVWTILMYLSLGGIPMLQTLIFKS